MLCNRFIAVIALWLSAFSIAQAQKKLNADSIRRVETQWVQETTARAIAPKISRKFARPQPGYALYFTRVDTVRLPYVVYVPKSYDPAVPTRLLVYLHGGVFGLKNFEYKDPDYVDESIFRLAEKYHALVLFPFGRKSFGWVYQPAAFEAVIGLVADTKRRYHVAEQQVYIGGLSNGGTATFWYADHHPELFAGYYTFSARPRLEEEMGTIDFSRLGNQRFYSLHAQDDSLFTYQGVRATYEQHRQQAPGWQLDVTPNGDHGFIYRPDGEAKMEALLDKLLLKRK